MNSLEAAAQIYKFSIFLYAILTIVSGAITKTKNFGFLTGVLFSVAFTPLVTIIFMAFMEPEDEVKHWWQKL